MNLMDLMSKSTIIIQIRLVRVYWVFKGFVE